MDPTKPKVSVRHGWGEAGWTAHLSSAMPVGEIA